MGKAFPDDLKLQIIAQFPGLATDANFNITSPKDPRYNCISWAMRYTDRWTQPSTGDLLLDGITWWPPGATDGWHISCLVDAFVKEGFERCGDASFEDAFLKVALYYNPDDCEKWTHAARQLRTRVWASKLGQAYDIEHGTPYSIEGDAYGKVYCIMRTQFYNPHKSKH
jgi:hypothetical protein